MDRRELLRNAGVACVAGVVPESLLALSQAKPGQHGIAQEKEPEVTATEDLMREHGVLRRTLLVYAELVPRLRQKSSALDAGALNRAAKLFHQFGEVYHEQMLEEQHIFPIVRKMSGRAAGYPDILVTQHQRGREITDYILSVTSGGSIASGNAEPLARGLDAMVRMYENHAAREDTIVFPAWKTNFTNKQLDEIGDQFEDIEHKMFGKDGFDDAESQISQVEQAFGLADLAQFTAPPPPK